jgi:hypothetical protein
MMREILGVTVGDLMSKPVVTRGDVAAALKP